MASPKRQKTSFLEAEDTKNEGNHVPMWVQKGREHAQQEAYRYIRKENEPLTTIEQVLIATSVVCSP